MIRSSRWASDSGLCWFPDSASVLFTSFKNEELYKTKKSEVHGGAGYGIAYDKHDRFQSAVFALNATTGTIRWFADGSHPVSSAGNQKFLVYGKNGLELLDANGKFLGHCQIPRIQPWEISFSPSGNLMLAEHRSRNPLAVGGWLTIIDLKQPDVQHAISEDMIYRFRWTR